jgi:hypothetical protein
MSVEISQIYECQKESINKLTLSLEELSDYISHAQDGVMAHITTMRFLINEIKEELNIE